MFMPEFMVWYLGSQPTATPSSKLPLPSSRTTVTSPAIRHHCHKHNLIYIVPYIL